ncbi:MAG TPA: TrkA family potassium uptake protein [Anaerolineales bacterium]|nr:TrkA family potassium uptake protein [Anaerolineales bacterium]
MKYIVVGCGRVGAELANRLNRQGHEVTVVDQAEEAFHNLGADFHGRTVEGEVLNRHVLQRAGVEEADGLAAVTTSDSLNAVVAHTARAVFRVPRVVARNYDPQRRALYEAFDLQVVGSSSWGAQRIEEMLYHPDVRTVFSAGNGEVEMYEVTVPPEWQDRTLADLAADGDLRVVAHTRAGRAQLPGPDLVLHAGDVLHVSATLQGIQGLRSRLEGRNAR